MSGFTPRTIRIGILTVLFALGALLGQGVTGALFVASAAHPCNQQECKKFLWIDWCTGDAGSQTYCNTSSPLADCITTFCDHP